MADTKDNAQSAAPKGETPKPTVENTPRAKLIRMGQTPPTGAGGKPTTQW